MVEKSSLRSVSRARFGTFEYSPMREPYRADFGLTQSDSKKRKGSPPAEPLAKRHMENPADPSQVESSQVESSQAESSQVDSSQAESSQGESSQGEIKSSRKASLQWKPSH